MYGVDLQGRELCFGLQQCLFLEVVLAPSQLAGAARTWESWLEFGVQLRVGAEIASPLWKLASFPWSVARVRRFPF